MAPRLTSNSAISSAADERGAGAAGRWLSSCRKTHIPGHWADDTTALGLTFKPKQAAKLTVKRDGDKLELCATDCVTLHRETPALVGRWRRDGIDYPDHPTKTWTQGEPLELDLGPWAKRLLELKAGSAQQVEQQCLHLVVGMVGHRDGASPRYLAQEAIAGRAGRILQGSPLLACQGRQAQPRL